MTMDIEKGKIRNLAWLYPLCVAIAVAAAMNSYGRWQYHRGFNTGADSAICAFAVGLDGDSAIKSQEACRNITDHDWIIDGFDPHGKDRHKEATK